MTAKKIATKMCKWDVDHNVLKCKENDGTWKSYDLNVESLSDESVRIKEKKIDEMMSIARRCFDTGKCKRPVKLTLFELDSCPACKAHKPVIDDIKSRFSKSGIPVTVDIIKARSDVQRFKSAGCNGTPCIASKQGTVEKLVYEGNRGEISAIAEILGLPNPLFTDLKREKPRRLMA